MQERCSLHQVSVQDLYKRSSDTISVQDLDKSSVGKIPVRGLWARSLNKISKRDLLARSLYTLPIRGLLARFLYKISCFVRAFALDMHMDMSQEPFDAGIDRKNAERLGYHLEWTPSLNHYTGMFGEKWKRRWKIKEEHEMERKLKWRWTWEENEA